MAVLDADASEIVIRVVYDGPPEAGKTTSLRALAGSLSQSTVSPEEDAGGRTLWFDWMEYTGGRYEGCRIRCQIVSVPGQRELTPRRFRLLKDADAVVYVGDSTRARLRESLEGLREMMRFMERTAKPPIGVLFQANKRDLTHALPLEELVDASDGLGPLDDDPVADRRALVARELVREPSTQRGPQRARARRDVVLAAALAHDASGEQRVIARVGEAKEKLLAEKWRETELVEPWKGRK